MVKCGARGVVKGKTTRGVVRGGQRHWRVGGTV